LVKKEYNALIERHGKYLVSNPSLAIRIDGNADERGGTEFNLALGQKRAEAVFRALQIYGVKDSQMEVISWGKEKSKATGNDEAAWAQNRRVDLGVSEEVIRDCPHCAGASVPRRVRRRNIRSKHVSPDR
jgi:peptidoglycan-associated lipoprotein